MGLVFLGSVDAASDATMATVTNTVGALFRDALTDLISAILSDEPAVIAAAQAAVADALAAQRIVQSRIVAPTGGQWTDLNLVDAALPVALDVRAGALNRPVAIASTGWHIPGAGTNATQILTTVDSTPETFQRTRTGGVWSSWVRFVDQGVLDDRVGALPVELWLVQHTDPGAPNVTGDEFIHRFVDEEGRASWLEAVARDGGPSSWSEYLMRDRLRMVKRPAGEYLFAFEDAAGKLTDLTVRASDGQFADFVVERLAGRMSDLVSGSQSSHLVADIPWQVGMRVPPVEPRLTRIAGWGSSTMARQASALTALANGWGGGYFNGGYGGSVGEDIAAHQGSKPYILDPVTLNGTNPVKVTGSWPAINRSFGLVGTVGGVRGTLSKPTGSAAVATFTPMVASTARVEGAFIPDNVRERDAVSLFNPCKNDLAMNVGYALSVQESIDLTHRMVDFQVAQRAEFRVLTHYYDLNLPSVSAERDRIAAWNDAMVTAYGPLTLRMDTYVGSADIYTDLGITPTSDDLAQIALGNKGPSLSADALHLTDDASAAVVQNLIAPSLEHLYV